MIGALRYTKRLTGGLADGEGVVTVPTDRETILNRFFGVPRPVVTSRDKCATSSRPRGHTGE